MLNGHADYIHLDIMDGTFVPNISFGFPVIEAVSKMAAVPLDAHFMVVHPERWFERCAGCGVRLMSFHYEAAGRRTRGFIREIRSLGMKAGVAVDPDVPVEKLFPYADEADVFVIMSVFAGFGGQKFIPESLERVARLKAFLTESGSSALIEVDGGVGPANAGAVRMAGADIAVAGSSVFRAEDPVAVIDAIRKA